MSMIQGGLLNPGDPKDRALAFKAMEFGEFASILDNDEGPERIRIHGENITMLGGQPVPVKPYDRQIMHIDGHSRYMRSPEAQAMFKIQPEIEQVFQEHMDSHLDWAEVPGANPVTMVGSEAGGPSSAPASDTGGLPMPGGGGGELPAGGGAGMGLPV